MGSIAIKVTRAAGYEGEYGTIQDLRLACCDAEGVEANLRDAGVYDATVRVVTFDFSDDRYADGRVVTLACVGRDGRAVVEDLGEAMRFAGVTS